LREEGAGTEEIGAVVEHELGLATKLIHIANTSFYAGRVPAKDVRAAVARLGLNNTLALTLAIKTLDQLAVPTWLDVEKLHRHSVEVAVMAAQLVPPEQASAALLG